MDICKIMKGIAARVAVLTAALISGVPGWQSGNAAAETRDVKSAGKKEAVTYRLGCDPVIMRKPPKRIRNWVSSRSDCHAS
jgi:hypothetical protein